MFNTEPGSLGAINGGASGAPSTQSIPPSNKAEQAAATVGSFLDAFFPGRQQQQPIVIQQPQGQQANNTPFWILLAVVAVVLMVLVFKK